MCMEAYGERSRGGAEGTKKGRNEGRKQNMYITALEK